MASAAELGQLELAYSSAWKVGAGVEAPVLREPGASYNPRPARIATILIKECRDLTVVEIVACFWVPALEKGFEILNPNEAGQLLAKQSYSALHDVSSFNLKPQALRVAAAVLVDAIRHLHMSSLSSAERQAKIEQSERFIAGLTASSIDARLFAVLEHATARGAPK